jgi:hypothetical protein
MTLQRRIWLFSLCVLVLTLAAVAKAATVRGQILDANNSPAPYIAVRVSSGSRGPSEFAYSGNDGRYYLPNVPPGNYNLEVWRGGRVVATVAISVQDPVADVAPVRVP